MRHGFLFLSTLALVALLSGCASGPQRSGTHPVQGICKSCKSYFVRGSWHHPQKHYDYDEVGIASWYGPGFHGKPKPYGEPFNQNAISAAHKTLPLPTIVRVTNLENNTSIKLLVDDRGPYVYDRVIDLSIGAAKELGMYNKGTAKVRVTSVIGESKALSLFLTKYGRSGRDPSGRTWNQIYDQEIKGKYPDDSNNLPVDSSFSVSGSKVITPVGQKKSLPPIKTKDLGKLFEVAHKSPAPSSAKTVLTKQQYFVQVGGNFVQYKNANKLLKNIGAVGPSGIKESVQAGGQKLYSVFLGPYSNKAIANKTLAKLSTTGHSDATIVKN